MGARDQASCTHILGFVVGADEGLQKLVAVQASVAVALQEVVQLSLRIVHVQLVVSIFILFIFVFVALIVVEVFNILLVWTVPGIFSAFFYGSSVVLRLVIDDLLLLWSLLLSLGIVGIFILLDVWPEFGVGELFGCDLWD